MTDEQIIKALECCVKNKNCTGCPLYKVTTADGCLERTCLNALSLITRQKAEIERLKEIEFMYNDLCR